MEENNSGVNSNNLNEQKDNQDYSFDATSSTGEAALGSYLIKSPQAIENVIPGPSKVIGSCFKTTFASFIENFKKPIKLIPIFILIVIWIVIGILEAAGNTSTPIHVISFLTFANGGMHGGFVGAIGGIIGKGIYACAFVALFGLFNRKGKGEKGSGKLNFKSVFSFSLNKLFAFILGIGLSMFFFLFISGGATRISFMGGFAAWFVSLMTCISSGFLFQFISSIFSKGKTDVSNYAYGLMQGLSIGMLLASLLGLININLVLFITGCVLVVAGTVLLILQATGAIKLGKEKAK